LFICSRKGADKQRIFPVDNADLQRRFIWDYLQETRSISRMSAEMHGAFPAEVFHAKKQRNKGVVYRKHFAYKTIVKAETFVKNIETFVKNP